MNVQEHFSGNYASAREKFLSAVELAGLEAQRYVHPLPGPNGLELSADVVRFGPADATRLLVLISGVHGVETLCGSACQTGLLRHRDQWDLPPDTAILLVHAINCWGAAHLRRNTEGNVDLCRNFIDFNVPVPDSRNYDLAEAALSSTAFTGHDRGLAARFIDDLMAQHGPKTVIESLMSGQYRDANGFSFGGNAPVWAHRTLQSILQGCARKAEKICLVEYHSGLGPYGYGMAVTMHDGVDLERVKSWFGHWVTAPNERQSSPVEASHTATGHTSEGYMRFLPGAQVTSIVLEFGTYTMGDNLLSLLEDHWLEFHGEPGSDLAMRIKQRLLETHYPRDPHWRQAVWDRSSQVIRQALEGLSGKRR